MKVLIWVAVLGVLASIMVAIGEYGLGLGLLGLKDEKYRLTSLLVITPIGILCFLAVMYMWLSLPIWMSLPLSLLILAGGIAVAPLLVSRTLPQKIRERW